MVSNYGLLIHSQARSSKSWSSKSCPLDIYIYICLHIDTSPIPKMHISFILFMVHLCLRKVQLPHAKTLLFWPNPIWHVWTIYRLLGFLHSWRNLMAEFIPKSSRIAQGCHFLVHQSLCDTVRSEDGKDLGSNTGENTSQTAITWSTFREFRVSKCFLSM